MSPIFIVMLLRAIPWSILTATRKLQTPKQILDASLIRQSWLSPQRIARASKGAAEH